MADASLSSRSDWARALLAICCASLASAFALASSIFCCRDSLVRRVNSAWLQPRVEKAINVNVMNGRVFMMISLNALANDTNDASTNQSAVVDEP